MNHNDLTNDAQLFGDEYLDGLVYDMNRPNISFPWKLHQLLEETDEREGCECIISWLPDRKSFKVHDQKAFVDQILPRYFKVTKYKSFQRQLNIYGFERITDKSANRGGYSHAYFVRGKPKLCENMKRQKIKGSGKSKALTSSVDQICSPSHEHPQQAMANEKRMPKGAQSSYNPHDGDTVMFHGKQFYFVDYTSCRDDPWSPRPLREGRQQQQQQQQQEMLPANISLVASLFSKPTRFQEESETTRAFLKTMLEPYFEPVQKSFEASSA
jgi:hypothetical protein